MHVGGSMRCSGSGRLSSAGLALHFFHLVLAIFEGDQRSRQLHIQHTAFSEELSVLMSAVRIALAALLLLLGANRAVAELMSADDHQAYQAAFAAARARAWSAMKRSAAAATERAPAKILLCLELTRANLARFADIAHFIDHPPPRPPQHLLPPPSHDAPQAGGRRARARRRRAGSGAGAGVSAGRVPAPRQGEPGLRRELVRGSRRQRRPDEAAALMQNPPKELVRPAAWWAERQLLVRQLLDDRKDKLAYALAAQRSFGESDVVSADLEFVSGWIALRRLNDPRVAYDHFARLYATVKLPVSLARGAYWAGRAADARGMADEAGKWVSAAPSHATTSYGQLAAAHLGITPAPAFPAQPQPTLQHPRTLQ